MKKQLLIILLCVAGFQGKSQTTISTFEDLTLSSDTFWDGRYDQSAGGFVSGSVLFYNKWAGGFWSGGFAYTNKKDSMNGTYTNLYSAITAKGVNNSSNYIIGQQDACINTVGAKTIGVYVTNGTYSYTSMKNGDSFAKKFGGASGNDPDYFLMSFNAWKNGVKKPDTVKFYLADYRFSNNSQDYIIKDWTFVDLNVFGSVDSVKITLSSSDTAGGFGMNTPPFFAMDNFVVDLLSSARPLAATDGLMAYPNPFSSELKLKNDTESELMVSVTDITGRLLNEFPLASLGTFALSTEAWSKGLYFVTMKNEHTNAVFKMIRQ